MNLQFVLMDLITKDGKLKTYRFQPIHQWISILVDRLDDIVIDDKSRMDRDAGLLRIYNSNKCSLSTTKCKLKNFEKFNDCITASFEHLYMNVGSGGGAGACYSFMLPISYKFTSLSIKDPYNKENYIYNIYHDSNLHLQIVQLIMQPSNNYCSFTLSFQAAIETSPANFLDSSESQIKLDAHLQDFFFDDGIKKAFIKHMKKALIFGPNFWHKYDRLP